ncbi:MAG TPA: O-methyltransferase [Halococcus sp.]|nr:O-methyltransferase [Halococcus sp.]
MTEMVSETVNRLLRLATPEMDDVLEEMETYARESGFPTVGPEVGAFYRLCARLVDAKSVFEFGSGYGYSAYWVAPVLPSDGCVVLTEHDSDELDMAREYLSRGGYADRAVFEEGDALEIIEHYDGPFDLVLVDNENDQYVETFETVRDKVPSGGMVFADNVITASGQFTPEDLLAVLDDEEGTAYTRGIADYYRRVRNDPEFETVLLPIGEGVLVSTRL